MSWSVSFAVAQATTFVAITPTQTNMDQHTYTHGRKHVYSNTGSPNKKLTTRSLILTLHEAESCNPQLLEIFQSFISLHSALSPTHKSTLSNFTTTSSDGVEGMGSNNQDHRIHPLYYLTAEFESDGRLVGLAKIRKSNNQDAIISLVVVTNNQRSQGVGSCLVENCIGVIATDADCQIIYADVVGSSSGAMSAVLRHNSFQRQANGLFYCDRLSKHHAVRPSCDSNILRANEAQKNTYANPKNVSRQQQQQPQQPQQPHERRQVERPSSMLQSRSSTSPRSTPRTTPLVEQQGVVSWIPSAPRSPHKWSGIFDGVTTKPTSTIPIDPIQHPRPPPIPTRELHDGIATRDERILRLQIAVKTLTSRLEEQAILHRSRAHEWSKMETSYQRKLERAQIEKNLNANNAERRELLDREEEILVRERLLVDQERNTVTREKDLLHREREILQEEQRSFFLWTRREKIENEQQRSQQQQHQQRQQLHHQSNEELTISSLGTRSPVPALMTPSIVPKEKGQLHGYQASDLEKEALENALQAAQLKIDQKEEQKQKNTASTWTVPKLNYDDQMTFQKKMENRRRLSEKNIEIPATIAATIAVDDRKKEYNVEEEEEVVEENQKVVNDVVKEEEDEPELAGFKSVNSFVDEVFVKALHDETEEEEEEQEAEAEEAADDITTEQSAYQKLMSDRIKFKLIFGRVDKDDSGLINVREMLIALRKDSELAKLLHLPAHIRQEDGTRAAFEVVFQELAGDDREITYDEFEAYLMNHRNDEDGDDKEEEEEQEEEETEKQDEHDKQDQQDEQEDEEDDVEKPIPKPTKVGNMADILVDIAKKKEDKETATLKWVDGKLTEM